MRDTFCSIEAGQMALERLSWQKRRRRYDSPCASTRRGGVPDCHLRRCLAIHHPSNQHAYCPSQWSRRARARRGIL